MSLSQQPVSPQKGDKSSFEHLVKTIKLLTKESHAEKINDDDNVFNKAGEETPLKNLQFNDDDMDYPPEK